ncbi:carbon monoxide dehydrogenase [Rhizobium sp. Leaf384]|uniref:CoxG family protein n=1 Tax=unclassified Rhizobium TaxID=2613769 RepID=UPI000714331E|nr:MULTISPECIES: carbon monoxide dehydrogenase subunit G [unclassified Rhizobium]KQR77941.1 carbon monoxide dehydrogenase [Rhizobium sp. Leaf341]KQS81152.1 carbon monoxide dehydrogenase [Rhizobium sp. Leaf384]KQS87060.1 carbon monoxide dehydrogenase [Rhizobium sp. Leaf383]
MDMTGEERIAAPRDAVWAALNDPEVLKGCIPGCTLLEWTSPTTLDAVVTVKFGFITMAFSGVIALTNMNPPESYTISGEGKGGLAGYAKGGADVRLVDDGDETILHYAIVADVSGKIASLGSKLVQSGANRIASRFFSDFTAAANAKAARS